MVFFPFSLHPSFPGWEILLGPQEMQHLFSQSFVKPIPLHSRSPPYGDTSSLAMSGCTRLRACVRVYVYFVIPEVKSQCASSTSTPQFPLYGKWVLGGRTGLWGAACTGEEGCGLCRVKQSDSGTGATKSHLHKHQKYQQQTVRRWEERNTNIFMIFDHRVCCGQKIPKQIFHQLCNNLYRPIIAVINLVLPCGVHVLSVWFLGVCMWLHMNGHHMEEFLSARYNKTQKYAFHLSQRMYVNILLLPKPIQNASPVHAVHLTIDVDIMNVEV